MINVRRTDPAASFLFRLCYAYFGAQIHTAMTTTTPYSYTTEELIDQLSSILERVEAEEVKMANLIAQVQPHYRDSARNLVHYMTLRAFDLRPIQEKLSMMSISSLGHSEGYTLTNLKKIIHLLRMVQGEPDLGVQEDFQSPFNYYRSKEQLLYNTEQLFGQSPEERATRIMVTMSKEAAYNYDLVQALIQAGMSIARINTSHETPQEWEAMIRHIRQAERDTQRRCLVYMDLSGPKLRTEAIDPAHAVSDPHKGDYLLLHTGDVIRLVNALPPRIPAQGSADEHVYVAVSLPQVLEDARTGERIFFDDGKIHGEVIARSPHAMDVRIVYAGLDGAKLRADKGINLPDTHLHLPSLTEEDRTNLHFIAQYADIVGYSFVRTPADVAHLQETLTELGRQDMGIILKVETKEAFENLPRMLLTAMRSPKVGVMIARGDLAVEVGFERIAEVQEEILWICEAAHIPGIWATQVLEKLASKGIASRAEITDAAMAARAECVMLNKGPYIVNAVNTLSDVISRMERHQFKRMNSLRPLQVARGFLASS